MRLPILLVLGVVGCGSPHGAVLTVASPDGPATATRIELVLASADPQFIATIDKQRTSPAKLDEAAVIYYRQRATGGIITSIAKLDAFTVRIEPDATTAPDEAFIPFVLAYNNDTLVGIGSVNDDAGDPTAITINDSVTVKYTVTMQALTAATASAAITSGQNLVVRCATNAQQPWISGIAWQGASGIQRRLLLPDLASDPLATDATSRDADLDCDQHAAGEEDCDDLRDTFFAGHRETCDGIDSNCNGSRYEVLDCQLGGGSVCGTGVQVCDELNPGARGACMPDPACACASGALGCTRCVLDFSTTSDPGKQTPCEPAVGHLTLDGCTITPCTVEVVGTTGDWEASVGLLETGPFLAKVVGAHTVFLRVKLGGDVMALPNQSTGTVQLAVTQALQTTLMGIDLELAGMADVCVPAGTTGNSPMTCSP